MIALTVTVSNLRKSIAEEKLAYRHYIDRGRAADRAGDKVTARLYRHIAHEENIHAREFASRLKTVLQRGR